MNYRKANSAFLAFFYEAVVRQLGQNNLTAVLEKASLPLGWAQPDTFPKMNSFEAARAYTGLQQAMRTYYGRSARGVLLRVGRDMWEPLLKKASLVQKAQSVVVRKFPVDSRRKQTLNILAAFLNEDRGDVTVHSLDMDLLLADHASPGTLEITADGPICYVTQGLIRESLYWATGHEHDIEETSCRALGEKACEFTIRIGSAM